MSTETEKKKIKIGAVIDYCRAKGLKTNKSEIFRFFGVLQQTGNNWYPGNGSSNNQQPRQPENRNGLPTLPNSDKQLPSPKRQNPVRNGGRDRKRLKSMMEDMQGGAEDYGSPPPLSPTSPANSTFSSLSVEPVIPPRRKVIRPTRKSGPRDGHHLKEELTLEIKSELYDDEICV